ncbi:MAG: transposase [Chloroflexi bacterium]|nr:transposase [Chloroflexota bacterium]
MHSLGRTGEDGERAGRDCVGVDQQERLAKSECIRSKTLLSVKDAQRIVDQFVKCYNDERLHSAISYVTPSITFVHRREMTQLEWNRRYTQINIDAKVVNLVKICVHPRFQLCDSLMQSNVMLETNC